MELRRLGTSGLRVSALSLGAMTFGASQTLMKGVTSSDQEARRVFDPALGTRVNPVDTPNAYNEGPTRERTRGLAPAKPGPLPIATKRPSPTSFPTTPP